MLRFLKMTKKDDQTPAAIPPAEATPADPAQQKIEELTGALARALADLANFRRRTEEERGKWMQVAQADLLHEILPLMANLDRSLTHLPAELQTNEWAKGILHIHQDWLKLLAQLGIKKIETVGQLLDPLRHSAMTTVPGKKDVIVQEFEAGYEQREIVIVPAKVAVGNGENGKTIDKPN